MRFISEDTFKGDISNPLTLNYYIYCNGNPVSMYDPSGNFGILAAIGIGALVGAAVNTAINLVSDYVDDGQINNGWRSYGRAIAEGAFGGALGGATAGCGLPIVLAAEGAGGFLSSAMGQYIENGKVNYLEAGLEGMFSVAFTAAGHYASKGFKRLFNICFTEETEILTEDGLKKIKDIKIGDKVYSKNEDTGESSYKEVVNLFRNKTKELVVLKINGKLIKATSEHPFWTQNRGWVAAKDLLEDDELEDENGNIIFIDSKDIQKFEEDINVYNFEVKDNHTYYVGEDNILVHNMCRTGNLASAVKWKGFSKGQLAIHFEKHVVKKGEFGKITKGQYMKLAKAFASETDSVFKETNVGNFIIKYDPNTRRVLVGHGKSREIRTFYKADFRDDDPFEAAKELAKKLSGK